MVRFKVRVRVRFSVRFRVRFENVSRSIVLLGPQHICFEHNISPSSNIYRPKKPLSPYTRYF